MGASPLLHSLATASSTLFACGETGLPTRTSPCSSSRIVYPPSLLLPRFRLVTEKVAPQGRMGCQSSSREHFLSSESRSNLSQFVDRRFLRNAGFLSSSGITEEKKSKVGVVYAAWTRRSRGEAAERPNRKSWNQRTDQYMRPFMLNVFFSKRYIHAKVVHRGTCKVVSVASTNAKDLRNTLPSLTDDEACRVVGKLIAERSKEADVFAITFHPNKQRIEGRLGIILDTIEENGIIFI